jgi:hypothetical protein
MSRGNTDDAAIPTDQKSSGWCCILQCTRTMPKPEIDYSLYLVTGRHLLPPDTDYYESLEEALKGGVTVVQVREKTEDTRPFLEIAKRYRSNFLKQLLPSRSIGRRKSAPDIRSLLSSMTELISLLRLMQLGYIWGR